MPSPLSGAPSGPRGATRAMSAWWPKTLQACMLLLALGAIGIVECGRHDSSRKIMRNSDQVVRKAAKGVVGRRAKGSTLIPGHKGDHSKLRQQTQQTYACSGCLTERTLRVLYMDGNELAVSNTRARAKAAELGVEYNCNDPVLALPECFNYSNWDAGWVGNLTLGVLDELGMEVMALTQANFSDESAEAFVGVSAYTRCVWDLKLGNVDICVGDFWETNERRSLVPFTSLMELDTMALVTLPTEAYLNSGFKAQDLLAIFRPFEWDVWVISAAMWLFATLAIYMVEFGQGNDDYSEEDEGPPGVTRHMLGLAKTLYLVMLGYFTCSVANQATRWPGRLVILGYGFFVYITVSSYAANMVNIMLANNSPGIGQVASISHLKSRASRLCVLESMMSSMSDVPSHSLVAFDDYGPQLEALYSGRCQAAVISQEALQIYVLAAAKDFQVCTDPMDSRFLTTCQSENGTTANIQLSCQCSDDADKDPLSCVDQCPYHHRYCNVLKLFDPDFNLVMGFALPVSAAMQDYMSAWLVEHRLSGHVETLREMYINAPHPVVCTDRPVDEGESSGELGLDKMAGNYVISGSVMVVGLVIHLVQRYRSTQGGTEGKTGNSNFAPPLEKEVKHDDHDATLNKQHSGHEKHLHPWQANRHHKHSDAALIAGLHALQEKLQVISERMDGLHTVAPEAENDNQTRALTMGADKEGNRKTSEQKKENTQARREEVQSTLKPVSSVRERSNGTKGDSKNFDLSSRSPRTQDRASDPLPLSKSGDGSANPRQSDPGPQFLGMSMPAPLTNFWNTMACRITGREDTAAVTS